MTGPMYDNARCPWNFLRLIGMRNIRVSAEERRVREGPGYIAPEDQTYNYGRVEFVLMPKQIVATLYSILRETGSQCRFIMRGVI